MPCFYLTPKQDDSNQELEVCIAEALYDVDSIVADPGAYTKEELATLHSQIRLDNDLDMVDTLNACHDRLVGIVGYKTHSHYFASRMRSSWVTGIPDTQLVRFI